MMSKAVLGGAAVLVVTMLAGCGSGDATAGHTAGPGATSTATPPQRQPTQSTQTPSKSAAAPAQPKSSKAALSPVSDEELGAALNRMIYGSLHTSSDGGQCFVEAVEQVGLSIEAQRYIVERGGDRWTEVGSALRADVSNTAADALMGQKFRTLVDRCADADLNAGEDSAAGSGGKAQPGSDAQSAMTNRPTPQASAPSSYIHVPSKYDINRDQPITTVEQLKPGLVSMMSSFGGQRQSELIKDSARCLSEAVLDAGFSQQTLHFIAGGAEIAAGSIAEYIPDEKDQQLWQSSDFSSSLSACLT
ncbi:hypothetical protein [Arthrobacter castelli]|uniref:hypothetical protein n=1 Tax=Arthrobacter castelli TaxID=271431 RepID=UPI00041BDA45|nr:hypothetical protein [Arthrobacter castelli]